MLYSAAPADTAAHWLKGRVLTTPVDRSEATLFSAAESLQKLGIFGTTGPPGDHAVSFYLLNHVTTAIMQERDLLEPLPQQELDVFKMYAGSASNIAARLFYYVLLITTREARHNNSSVESKLATVHKAVAAKYTGVTLDQCREMFEFTKTCPDTSNILSHLVTTKTKGFPLGPFCKLLSVLYYKCSWGSMYGGPKWGNIADALFSFVSGEWTAEMFADTAFTLAHNTAPIFNKGMLYSGPGSGFIELLDVQRAGMVPNWLAHEPTGQSYAANNMVYNICRTVRPGLFETPVDWAKVQTLGAVGNYAHKVPKLPPKPPAGCSHKMTVDHNTEVWVLEKRAA